MSHQYVVMAAGHALYGPFDTAEAAQAWALHPNRTPDVRFRSAIVPLFGGVLLRDDEPEGGVIDIPPGLGEEVGEFLVAEMKRYEREARRWTGVARP